MAATEFGNWQSELDSLLVYAEKDSFLKTFHILEKDLERSKFVYNENLLA